MCDNECLRFIEIMSISSSLFSFTLFLEMLLFLCMSCSLLLYSVKLFTFAGMSFSSQDSSAVDLDDSGHYYSVWISYAEIYNEFIYDLLGEPPTKNKLRPVLKLQEDRNHNLFIKGEHNYNHSFT